MAGLIVHEWVAESGGSENVVDEFARLYPGADLQVLWTDAPDRYALRTYETWLARTPLRRHKALALPFLPLTWRRLHPHQDYEWMLVSSHLFAHHASLRSPTNSVPKLVYAHTPARYVWEPELDRRGASLAVRSVARLLQPMDRRRAQEATAIAANSTFTRDRIERTWGRQATVIYPPVNTERIGSVQDWANQLQTRDADVLAALPDTYVLGASRFVSYKRLEIAIAAGEAIDVPVVLAGSGPHEQELRQRAATAKVPVHFVIRPSDPLLYALYQNSIAFVFPAIEDFGIMPIEAMAAGAPVIVPHIGGAAESTELVNGGAVFDDASASSLRRALDDVSKIDRVALRGRVDRFSSRRFRNEISSWKEEAVS